MKNKIKVVLLGFLARKDMTGYDLKQAIDCTINHFWKVSYGQIYPTLKILVEQELARVQEVSQEGVPDKKVYTITNAGRAVVEIWLEDNDCEERYRSETLLKINNGDLVSGSKTIDTLTHRKAQCVAQLEGYKAIRNQYPDLDKLEGGDLYSMLTLDFGLDYFEFLRQWYEKTEDYLRSRS